MLKSIWGHKWLVLIVLLFMTVSIFGVLNYCSNQQISQMEKKIKEAKETVEKFKSEKIQNERNWINRETEYKRAISQLNKRLNSLEVENSELENKIRDHEKRLVEIVVPNRPDDICPKFIETGFRSCRRITKSRR